MAKTSELTLYQLSDKLLIAQEQLAASEFDEQTIRDTLEGLEGEVAQKMEGCLSLAENLFAAHCAINDRVEEMRRRSQMLWERCQWLREYVKANMERTGIPKIECPYFVARIAKNPPRVVIDSLGEIPKGFIHYPPPPEPSVDRKAVAEAWKRGEAVPGTHMEQGTRLEVK